MDSGGDGGGGGGDAGGGGFDASPASGDWGSPSTADFSASAETGFRHTDLTPPPIPAASRMHTPYPANETAHAVMAPPVVPRTGERIGMAPPTVQGVVVRKSTWPTVIGIIGIVLSGWGILGGIWGILGGVLFGVLSQVVAQSSSIASSGDFFWANAIASIVSSCVDLGCWGWGLWVFIAMLKRKPEAPQRVRLWAAWRFAFALVNGLMGAAGFYFSIKLGPGAQGTPFPGFEIWMSVGMFVLVFLFACIWPTFLLIWLRRESIKLDIATWPTPQSGAR